MSRPLVVAFVAAQALDLATYLQAPELEANPVIALLPVEAAVVAKVAGVAVVLGVLRALRAFPAMQHAGLAIGIAEAHPASARQGLADARGRRVRRATVALGQPRSG